MKLVIDIGNTSIKLGVFDDQKQLIKIEKYSTKKIENNFLKKSEIINYAFDEIKIGSVVPSKNQLVINELKKFFSIEPYLIKNSDFTQFFNLKKFNLSEVGTDILSGALYLKNNFHSGLLITFGTATVATIVDDQEILGVAIAPAIDDGLLSLNHSTELTKTDLFFKNNHYSKSFDLNFGFNTETALLAGATHVTYGFINSTIEYAKQRLAKLEHVIISGGKAELINKKDLKHSIQIEQEITLKGYSLINKKSGN